MSSDHSTTAQLTAAIVDLNLDRVRALLDAGADVFARSRAERTPLHVAAHVGFAEAATLLLDLGAPVDAKDWMGSTPLHAAARYGRGGDLEDPDPQFRPFGGRRGISHPQVAAALTEELKARIPALPRDLQPTDPVPASERSALIGESFRALGPGGRTELHAALQRRGVDVDRLDPVFAQELLGKPGCLAIAAALLEHGADANAVDEMGESPLYAAVSIGEPAMVELLVAHGAAVDGHFSTARESWFRPLAAAIEYRRPEMITILVRAGAQLETDDLFPLHVAARMGLNAELLAQLIMLGAQVDRRDSEGITPLILAVQACDAASARLLLDHGADVNARTADGTTPLHELLAESEPAYVDLDTLRLLVDRGADLSVRNQAGNTPSEEASDREFGPDVLEILTPKR